MPTAGVIPALPLNARVGPRARSLTFIRAPQIVATGEGVETLVSVDEAPVAVRFGNQIGITFHPELDEDNTLYQLFLGLIDAHA